MSPHSLFFIVVVRAFAIFPFIFRTKDDTEPYAGPPLMEWKEEEEEVIEDGMSEW